MIFILLVVLSAFFSSSEIGIMSVPRHLIESLIKQGNTRAQQLMWLKDRTDKLLITILIGNNLVNTLTAALATKIAITVWANSWFEAWIAVWIATWIITVVLLLFGEILPKTMATRVALPFGLFIAPIYIVLVRVFRPIIWVIEKIIRLFDTKNSSHIRKVNQEEVEALVDIAREQWSIEDDMARHIKKIIDFHDTTVQEVITPRIRMEALDATMSVKEALDAMKQFSHTRVPVYQENIDSIEWVASHRELVHYKDQGLWDKKLCDISLQKALKIPLTMPIDKVMEVFKKQHRQMAIVMDEYGGVSWLITLEDIIEEIFGEFIDETDKEITPIKNDWDSYIVQGSVLIDDLLEHINLTWNDIGLEEQAYSGETVSYVITSELERFPEKNEKLIFQSPIIDPQKLDDNHVWLHIQTAKRDDNTIHEVIVTVVYTKDSEQQYN